VTMASDLRGLHRLSCGHRLRECGTPTNQLTIDLLLEYSVLSGINQSNLNPFKLDGLWGQGGLRRTTEKPVASA
jgi:hypothetical protein